MVAPLDAPWNNNILSDSVLGEVTSGKGTSFPSTWEVGRTFLRTDESKLYFNDGTEGTPVWISISGEDFFGNGNLGDAIDPAYVAVTTGPDVYQYDNLTFNSNTTWQPTATPLIVLVKEKLTIAAGITWTIDNQEGWGAGVGGSGNQGRDGAAGQQSGLVIIIAKEVVSGDTSSLISVTGEVGTGGAAGSGSAIDDAGSNGVGDVTSLGHFGSRTKLTNTDSGGNGGAFDSAGTFGQDVPAIAGNADVTSLSAIIGCYLEGGGGGGEGGNGTGANGGGGAGAGGGGNSILGRGGNGGAGGRGGTGGGLGGAGAGGAGGATFVLITETNDTNISLTCIGGAGGTGGNGGGGAGGGGGGGGPGAATLILIADVDVSGGTKTVTSGATAVGGTAAGGGTNGVASSAASPINVYIKYQDFAMI